MIATDYVEKDIIGVDKSKFVFKKLDVTNKESLKGLCDGLDAVITIVGLTTFGATV